MTDEIEGQGLAAAAPDSPLASLRERRERVKAKLFKDYPVPRYDPPIFVRYKPVSQKRIDQENKKARASKDPDATVIANATILADACLGVFEVIDGQEVSIDPAERDPDPENWPKFGDELAALLGVPSESRGRSHVVVRALYATDGDVISTAVDLGEWSGYSQELLERDPEGN